MGGSGLGPLVGLGVGFTVGRLGAGVLGIDGAVGITAGGSVWNSVVSGVSIPGGPVTGDEVGEGVDNGGCVAA